MLLVSDICKEKKFKAHENLKIPWISETRLAYLRTFVWRPIISLLPATNKSVPLGVNPSLIKGEKGQEESDHVKEHTDDPNGL